MAAAGYSGTPLLKKLGIEPGTKLFLVNEPGNYFDLLGTDINQQICKSSGMADIVHLFVKNRKQFETEMKKIIPVADKNSGIIIWVSWYKKSSGMATDVTEDTIRNFALKSGLVDVKVCAVSEIWSALKLVVPLNLRHR